MKVHNNYVITYWHFGFACDRHYGGIQIYFVLHYITA